jgi:predicted NBD/HSP70 family sugar kinase
VNEPGAPQRKASVRDVRRANRALLLRHLLFGGETSRASLGEATSLSPATVTNLVAELIDEGTVVERGQSDSPGGRPRTLLAVDPDAAVVFGADVGETRVDVQAFDLTMRRLGAREFPFSGRRIEPAHVTKVITEFVGSLLDELGPSAGARERRVLGLGLGVPGIVEHPESAAASPDPRTEPVVHAQVVGWESETFAPLARRLGMPVLIDNGAKTTTQAESWFGSARGVEHGVVVFIGDGAGAGIITNGRLYRGSSSRAGEGGHTKISLDGVRCRCGSVGCVETYVGASAVLERWRGRDEAWRGRELAGVDELFAAYRDGDEQAQAALQALVDHLGLALANLVNLYNPQQIVVAGWFGDRIVGEFLADVRAAVRRYSLPQPGDEVVVDRSTLGPGIAALGAATLPLDRFIEHGWPA